MATLTQIYKPRLVRIVVTNKLDDLIHILKPRRCMLVSVALILAGLCIPLLMALELLPVTLLLGFIALALIATGSLLVLLYCGEI
jgi:O-antigen/teichoic acid export membrane protein